MVLIDFLCLHVGGHGRIEVFSFEKRNSQVQVSLETPLLGALQTLSAEVLHRLVILHVDQLQTLLLEFVFALLSDLSRQFRVIRLVFTFLLTCLFPFLAPENVLLFLLPVKRILHV